MKVSISRLLTCGIESLASAYNIHSGHRTLRILGTARQETSRNEFVHFFIVSLEITYMGSRVDGRMRLIVVLALAWSIESTLLEADIYASEGNYGTGAHDQPLSKTTPRGVHSLFTD